MFSGFLTVAVMINLPTSKNPFGRMVTSKQLTRNCAAEMFGPPLVMPMAHRNRLRQGTMRGLGQVLPPHTGKRLRGCYVMNFSLHPEIVKRFWPKANVLVHFRRSAMLSYLWANAATLKSCIEKWGTFATCHCSEKCDHRLPALWNQFHKRQEPK